MKKNMAKGLATALSLTLMASVVAPVGSVFAARPDLSKRYKNVYQGTTYKYTTKNTKGLTVKWTVTGKSKNAIKLAKKTGTTNYIKVDSKGKKVSGATVEARFYKKVKKNGKYVYKLVRKSIDYVNIRVSAKSISINNKVESLKVNQEYDFNRTMTPKNTTSKTYWTITTKDGKETNDASISKDGVFTASKAGEYIVTATARNFDTGIVRGTDSVTFKVVDAVVSARQTKPKEIEVELTSDIKVTKDDFKVVGPNNVNTYIDKIEQNGKMIKISFFVDLQNSSIYEVYFNNEKLDFSTTDGKVTDIALDKIIVEAGKEEEIKVQFKDANGVVVKEVGLDATGKEEVNVETTSGYVTGDKLVLYKVGDKATIKATYHTYEYDNTTGKEKGVVERSFEVTAVDKVPVSIKESRYTIVNPNETVDWSKSIKANTQLPLEDTYVMWIQDKDSKGIVQKYEKFESSDPNAVTITYSAENKVWLKANKTGSYHILVKDDKDNVIATFPITVVAKAKISSIFVDKESINMSNFFEDKKDIKFEFKDQYGNKVFKSLKADNFKFVSGPSGVREGNYKDHIKVDVNSETISFTTNSNTTDGTYTFKYIESGITKIIKIIVEKPYVSSANVRIEGQGIFDATVTDKTYSNSISTMPIRVVSTNGVALGAANNEDINVLDNQKKPKDVKGTVKEIIIRNSNNEIIYKNVAGIVNDYKTFGLKGDSYSTARIISENNLVGYNAKDAILEIKNILEDEGKFSRFPIGKYKVEVKYDLSGSLIGEKPKENVLAITSFEVKDDTSTMLVSQLKTSVDTDITRAAEKVGDRYYIWGTPDKELKFKEFAYLFEQAFKFTYKGEEVKQPAIERIYGHYGEKSVYISKVDVLVDINDSGSKKTIVPVIIEKDIQVDDLKIYDMSDPGTETPATTLTSLTVTGGDDAKTNKAVTFTIKPNDGYKFKADETVTISATTTDGEKPKDVIVTAKADDIQLTGDVTFTKAGTYKVTVKCGEVTSIPELEVKVTDEVVPAEDITASLGTITSDGITGTLSGQTTGTVEFTSTGLDDVENTGVVKDKITFTGATGTVTVTEASVTSGTLTLKLSGLKDGTAENLIMNIAEGSGLKKSGKDVKATDVTVNDKRA